jgi:hypothetical protein
VTISEMRRQSYRLARDLGNVQLFQARAEAERVPDGEPEPRQGTKRVRAVGQASTYGTAVGVYSGSLPGPLRLGPA